MAENTELIEIRSEDIPTVTSQELWESIEPAHLMPFCLNYLIFAYTPDHAGELVKNLPLHIALISRRPLTDAELAFAEKIA